jgi:erythronate-4-phosphate dehydrogenase
VGNVGSKVEKFARIMGMNVLLNDPPRARREGAKNFVGLGIALFESDIISVHVPLNVVGEDFTYHLFNSRTLKKMKKRTWFINSSRGEVTDTAAIKKVLSSGKLGGAVLDVWEHEPDIDLKLMSGTFLSTPHIAGYSTDGKANGTSMVVNSLCKHFNLPLTGWYPGNVPKPEKPLISINCKGLTDEDIVRKAVFHTYNVDEDNLNLRSDPSNFEKLRSDYRNRREFKAFTVNLSGGSKRTREILEGLGFKVI